MPSPYVTGPVQLFVGRTSISIRQGASEEVAGRIGASTTPTGSQSPTPITDQPEPELLPKPAELPNDAELATRIMRYINAVSGGWAANAVDPNEFILEPPKLGGKPIFESVPPFDSSAIDKLIDNTNVQKPPDLTINTQCFYLGTCEVAPAIEIRRHYKPIYYVPMGKAVPYDVLYEGQDAIISMTLTNWSEILYAVIGGRMNQIAGGGLRGVDRCNAIGSMVNSEGMALRLWLQFPYAAKPVFAANAMVPGYAFYQVRLLGPDTIDPGTKPAKLRLVWHATKVFDPATGDQYLFDHDMSAVPILQ